MRTRGWRRIGTAIVRWPGPILVATIAIALIGLLALPRYKTSYDARPYMPASAPANVGYAAAERHFSQARLNPELLMIEADHDLRNSDRHDPAGARRQGGLPHRRHRAGAVDHPAAGHAAGPHLDPVPDQRGQRVSDQQPAVPAGPRRRPAQAGRRDQQLDRHSAAAVCAATTIRRRHRRADQGIPEHGRHGPGPARQDRQLRRLLPAAAQLLLLGAALFRHPGLRRAAVAVRRARRHRRADRPTGRRRGQHRQAGCAAAETARADPAADRELSRPTAT